jgi:hypothetical protein
MSVRAPGRRNHATTAVVVAAVTLAGLAAAGCSHQPATARASVQSCTEAGIDAIRHHVTVTSVPSACQGLTRAQVNFAVAGALHSAAAGARGKARQRARIARVSHFLEHLVTAVPVPRPEPQVAGPAARQASRTVLSLIALCTWLITIGLGLSMMASWIARGRRRRAPAGRPPRPPARNLAHFGLATAGLLTWLAYLATGVTGVAWAACALLLPVVGLGMTLVFLSPAASPAESAATAQAALGETPGIPVRGDQLRVRRPPVLVISAHIAFATATVLFAFLTAVGAG